MSATNSSMSEVSDQKLSVSSSVKPLDFLSEVCDNITLGYVNSRPVPATSPVPRSGFSASTAARISLASITPA